ncbi:DUF536 domain-containing protein [Jeotgalibaca dankookensis]|uniref:DUF536 domain-containing protein n=1 Tax=Jeotgalibaca dankookensis TaxID=708126 RepID=UPI0007809652|nr:DUF536 domain-containing protein [Jeotgalibaca dankookensis]
MQKKTIKELADEIGVSKTAINKKVTKTMKKNFFTKVGNRFEINEEGQKIIKSMFIDYSTETANHKPQSETAQTKTATERIEMGKTQTNSETKESPTPESETKKINDIPKNAMRIIENYQNQLKEKEQQLAQVHKLLDQQQQLTLQSNRQNERLQLELKTYEEGKITDIDFKNVNIKNPQNKNIKWWQFWL